MKTLSAEKREELMAVELRRLAGVRLFMLDKQPFWGHLLMSLRLVPTFELPAAAATDCLRTIWFNPHRTTQLNFSQLGFLLAHEVGHIALLTNHRQNGRDPRLWNRATDYAINRIVAEIPAEAGSRRRLYEVPQFKRENGEITIPLMDSAFDNLPAESIYQRLLLENPTQRVVIRLHLPGNGPRVAGGAAPGDQSPGSFEDGDLVIDGVVDHEGGLDVHLPSWVTEKDIDEWQRLVREALDHWQKSGRRGSLPSSNLRRLAERAEPIARDWRQVLFQFAEASLDCRDEYSRARPNRRYLLQDLIVPSVQGEAVSDLVIALDTSGSMTETVLSQALQAVEGLAALAGQCLLLTADAAVQQVVQTDRIEAFVREHKVKGGGGTDHRPVFKWLAERQIIPALFIGITDLMSRFPAQEPGYPVVWLAPRVHAKAPWGRLIELHL